MLTRAALGSMFLMTLLAAFTPANAQGSALKCEKEGWWFINCTVTVDKIKVLSEWKANRGNCKVALPGNEHAGKTYVFGDKFQSYVFCDFIEMEIQTDKGTLKYSWTK